MTINLTAARSGDRRAALEALRDTLAGLLDTTESQVHAQLSAQYRATLLELAEIDGAKGQPKGVRDELKAKRDGRSGGRTAAHASSNA